MYNYNFALNWKDTLEEQFITLLKKACEDRKLSFLWINKKNIISIIKQLKENRLKIDALLDGEATYNKKGDIYAKLCYAAKDAGAAIINDPDRTRIAIDKSVSHFELINAGIQTPYTVIVRSWEPRNRGLAQETKKRLGIPFIIKPACGYGQKGLIKDARGTIEEIAKARSFDYEDNFLLQEKIIPIRLGNKRAWFRLLHVFDAIIPCWWDDQTNIYEHVSEKEFYTHDFLKLVEIVAKIASLSKMVWFSSEIAIDKKKDRRRFVCIDYINDQCCLNTKSETSSGLPDNIVKYITRHIVEKTYDFIHKKSVDRRYKVFLKGATIELKGLSVPSSLLRQGYP
ncbi:MAG: hypothetical protein KJ593_07710 [Candidatus Omnitrophica bacterium]|nr:hypothetical protein [Candidatus Omnitrophota bacterium]